MKLVEEYSTVLSSLGLITNHNVSQVAAQVEAGYAWNQSDINITTYKNKQNKKKHKTLRRLESEVSCK